jgi:tetratricopeptide (TPR) repeat protein
MSMNSTVQQQLERICRSETFQATPRLRDFLAFLTSRGSVNDGQVFKESVIGVEFFHRDPGYDAKKDPIVRVEAHRLRRRLLEYYSQEGASDPWRIELLKGSYAPRLRKRDDAPSEWRLAVLIDASDELTAEGLAVELISKLGNVHGLTVLAPRSALSARDSAEAVRNLRANAVLECRLEGMNLRAELRRADSAGLTRIGTFNNVIQPAVEALSRFVAASLGTGTGTRGVPKRQVIDRETYQLYLSGRAWFHRWSPDNLANAAAHFEKVIERCPEFAPAYAGLADIHVLLAYWHVKNARETLELGRSYASKAVELDPECTDAYCSLAAFEATLNRNWTASEALFRRALDANPSNALALNWLSIIAYVPQMRFEDAVDAVFAAYDLDPASPEIGNEVVWVRLCCNQFEESAEQGRRIVALHPTFLEAYWSLGLAESALGHYSVACEVFDRAEKLGPDVPFTLALRSHIEGVGGNAHAAKQYLHRLKRMGPSAPVRELYLAFAYGGIGEIDCAMEHLQRAVEAADPIALYVDVFVPFAPLRNHPGFEQIRQQQRLSAVPSRDHSAARS